MSKQPNLTVVPDTPARVRTYTIGRSIKSYRVMLDQMMRLALQGKISWDDVSKAAASTKVSTELFMAERILKAQGGDEEATHEVGDVETEVGEAKTFRKQKVKVTSGINKRGDTVDQTEVIMEGSAGDGTLETDAQVETLR
jgi:hypothetical protein